MYILRICLSEIVLNHRKFSFAFNFTFHNDTEFQTLKRCLPIYYILLLGSRYGSVGPELVDMAHKGQLVWLRLLVVSLNYSGRLPHKYCHNGQKGVTLLIQNLSAC
jgi:hypothetical protein